MKLITTNQELLNIQKQIASKAILYVGSRASELLKNLALEYMSTGGSEWYERSNEFQNAWGTISQDVNEYIVGYLSDTITPVLERYQHGNIYSGSFVGDDLANAILNGYEVFNTGVFIDSRDFWSDFINQVNEKIPTWIKESII